MKIEYKVIILSLLTAVLVWIVDALLDFFLLYKETFWEIMIFGATPHSIYARSMMVICFLLAGLLVSRIVIRRAQTESALKESEQKFKAVFDTVVDGILLADMENKRFLTGNKAICQMLGYRPKEIENLSVGEIHPEKDLPYVIGQFQKQMTGEITLAKDIPVKRRDGSIFYADINSSPVVLAGKEYLVGIFRDITERREAERLLQESEESYRDLWENINDLVQSVAPNGSFLYVNNAWLKTMGYSRKEVAELSLLDIIHPESRAHCMNIFSRVISGETVANIEAKFLTKDGRTIIVEGSANCRFKEGKPVATRGLFRDITMRKVAEMALKARTHDLEERIKETDCLYSLSKLIEEPNISLEDIFKRTVDLIPSGWQYSEVTCARIIFEDREYKTDNFKMTEGGQKADIRLRGKKEGVIEVYYTEERPEEAEGPFLKEERGLIEAIAWQMGRVAESKRAEDALKASEEKYRSVILNISDIVFQLSPLGFIQYVSPRVEEIYGYKPEDLIGSHLKKTTPVNEIPRALEALKQVLSGKEIKNFEITQLDAKGNSVFMEINATPMRKHGKIVSVQGIMRDITGRRRAEEELRKSKEQYQTLARVSPVGIFHTDAKGKCVYVNQRWCKISGLTFEEALGKGWENAIHPDDRKRVSDTWYQSARRGMPFKLEYRFQRPDGRVTWVLGQATAEKNEKGEILGCVGTVTDITSRKKMEDALHAAYTEFRQIFNSTASGMCIIDKNMDIIRVNDAFLNLFHLSQERVIGKKCYDIFRCREKDTPVCTMERLLKGEESFEGELERKRGDGSVVSCIVTAVPFRNPDGEIIGVLENFKDITERKKIEESQRFAQLGKLASDMSHEINNPLMIISGRAQLSLMDASNTRKTEENLQIIKDQCERAKDIIKKVYEYSQPAKGEVREVNVNDSLETVINLVEHQFSLRNIKIKKNFLFPPPRIKIDEKQIQEVFMNLLTNAADAMPLGGDITISASEEMGYVRIDFKDSGEGISEENLKRIFDPFFSTRDIGTGLGLSISRSIIKAHDGELKFSSKIGEGTTATVLLPIVT